MRRFEERNAYFDRLCNSEGLMWLGQKPLEPIGYLAGR